MDSSNFLSRNRAASPAPQSESAAAHSNSNKKDQKSSGIMRIAFAGLVVSVALLIFALLAFIIFGGGKSESEFIQKDRYQAIFLSDQNGQVYFGKLSILNANYYKLTDIFYVRVEQVQPETGEQSQQNISLAKLGNELHGPQDEMFIARDKVLFWENLKDDGQVVKAIQDYKENGGNTNTNSSTESTESTNNNSNSGQ